MPNRDSMYFPGAAKPTIGTQIATNPAKNRLNALVSNGRKMMAKDFVDVHEYIWIHMSINERSAPAATKRGAQPSAARPLFVKTRYLEEEFKLWPMMCSFVGVGPQRA